MINGGFPKWMFHEKKHHPFWGTPTEIPKCVASTSNWRNGYRFFVLLLNIYLVDVLFNTKDPKTEDRGQKGPQ